MEVAEIIRLSDWFKLNTLEVEPLYSALVSIL